METNPLRPLLFILYYSRNIKREIINFLFSIFALQNLHNTIRSSTERRFLARYFCKDEKLERLNTWLFLFRCSLLILYKY